MDFKKLVSDIQEKQDSWILESWKDFDSFQDWFNSNKGSAKKYYIPVNVICPRSEMEWTEAEAFASMTYSAIEITNTWNRPSGNIEFWIYDGHNRLKTEIAKGATEVEVIIV